MMWRASCAISRAVTRRLGSENPSALVKVDFSRPISRARLVNSAPNAVSLPAIPSAMAMQASLAESTMMPWMRSSTLTSLWIAANMVEPWDGAPPLRQAFSLILKVSSSLSRPCLISLNTYSSVISLARLAGATS